MLGVIHRSPIRSAEFARRLTPTALLLILAIVGAGCGQAADSHPIATSSGHTANVANPDRETAEGRLNQIGQRLDSVLADYTSGKRDQAYTEAKAVSAHLYEGTTEGVVAKDAPAVQRQLDSLLATTLPTAIHNNSSVAKVATLVHHAEHLTRQGLTAIKKTEESSG